MNAGYLTTGQVARLLGVSKGTILRAVERGELRAAWKMPSGALRLLPPDVEVYARRLAVRRGLRERATLAGKAVLDSSVGREAVEPRLATVDRATDHLPAAAVAVGLERLSAVVEGGRTGVAAQIEGMLVLLADSLQVGATCLSRHLDGAWHMEHVHDRVGMGLHPGEVLPCSEMYEPNSRIGALPSLIVEDARIDARFADQRAGPGQGIGAITVVPLHREGGKPSLALSTLHPRSREVPSGEVALLRLAGRLIVQMLDLEDLREAERLGALRLAALQEVTASLAAVRTPEEIAGVVMHIAARATGAVSGAVRALSADGAWLDWIPAPGYEPGLSIVYTRNAIKEVIPFTDAVRTGQAVWLESPQDALPRYAALLTRFLPHGIQAAVALPLSVEGRIIGALNFNFAQPRRFSAEEREFIGAVAGLTAQALDRARLYVAEQERARVAEELALLQEDFVAAVSHELRSPLTAILGYTELLQMRWAQLSDERRLDQLNRIAVAAGRQRRLVEDVLLVSQFDGEAVAPWMEAVTLAPLAREAATAVQASYRNQHIDLDGPAALQVQADPARLAQVLANLIDNAAKYSPETAPIEVSWREEGEMIVVRVRDRGSGIPVDGRERLFTRFGRLPASGMRAGRVGIGLGLFLGRRLAQAMDGDLDLETTGPTGSTFRLLLPRA